MSRHRSTGSPTTRPSPATWLLTISYGLGAYSIHKTGVILGFYPAYFWFQLLTHFLSSTALVLLLLVAGRSLGLGSTSLLAFVLGGWILGVFTWELIEFLDLVPWLTWWGIEDFLVDLASNTVGLLTVLGSYRARNRFGKDVVPAEAAATSRGD